MNRQQLIDYVKGEFDVEADYPFDKDFQTAIFRHKNNRKWFGAIINVSADKLGIDKKQRVDILNTKIEQMLKPAILQMKGVYPAYHMNKTHWVSILFAEANDDDTKALLDMSFELTRENKKTQK